MNGYWDRKYLPLAGYLVLVIGVALAIYIAVNQGRDAREQIERESIRRDAVIRMEANRADAAIEAARVQRVKQLNRFNTDQCEEIEDLKAAFREQAIENYRNLDRNGKLLGIRISPELRAQSLKDRNDRLKKFKKNTCPRLTIK